MTQRYEEAGYANGVSFEKDDEGTWVLHTDHQRETAQLQARVAELEGALREAARLEQWEPENVWAHLSEWAE